VLALVIGALTGLTVVAFILLTERAGMRLYPVDGIRWRRLVFPVGGSLGSAIYCTAFSLALAVAECLKPRQPCLPVEAPSRCERGGQVLLHAGNTGKRNPTWARGAFSSNWLRHSFRTGTPLGAST